MGGTSTWVKWRDTAEAILAIGVKFVVPVLAVMGGTLGLPPGVAVVLSSIPELMAELEKLLPAKGQGPARKEQVLGIAEVIMNELDKRFTGGAATSFARLKPTINAIIESTVAAVNELAPQIIGDDVVAPPFPATGMDVSGIKAPVDSP